MKPRGSALTLYASNITLYASNNAPTMIDAQTVAPAARRQAKSGGQTRIEHIRASTWPSSTCNGKVTCRNSTQVGIEMGYILPPAPMVQACGLVARYWI